MLLIKHFFGSRCNAFSAKRTYNLFAFLVIRIRRKVSPQIALKQKQRAVNVTGIKACFVAEKNKPKNKKTENGNQGKIKTKKRTGKKNTLKQKKKMNKIQNLFPEVKKKEKDRGETQRTASHEKNSL